MSKIIYIVILIFCLSLVLGTGVSAVNAPAVPQPNGGGSGFVPPDTSVISGGPAIGPNPLVKTPVSVQTGIVRAPVVIPGESDTTSGSAPLSGDLQMASPLNSAQYAPDRLIVKLKPGLFSSSEEMAKAQSALNDQIGVTVLDDASALGVEGMQVVQIPPGSDLQSVATLFSMNPFVEYAEPDYVLSIENGIVPGKAVVPPSVQIPTSGSTIQAVQKPPVLSSSSDARTTGVDDALVQPVSSSKPGIMKISPTERQQIAMQAQKMGTLSDAPKIIPQGSKDLLSYISYVPSQRNQGSCGNCWVWASTGAVEVAKTVQTGTKDRLSIQYFNSNYNGGTGSYWACNGGWAEYFANFHNSAPYKQFIPWSNRNASYYDGTACSSGSCSAGTKMPASYITTTPNYPITSISTSAVNTYGITQSQAINNIKAQIDQNKAVWWGYFLPDSSAWNAFYTFWGSQPETALWNPDPYNGKAYTSTGGGHAVLIVGYDDSSANPDEWYWVVLNSWGTTANRPNGLFRLKMKMNYSGNDGSWPNHYFNVFTVSFSSLPQTGSLSVNSTPSGAAIWLDGGSTGKVTPDTLTNVTAGSHTVKLTLTGYSDYQTTVSVPSGGTASVNAVLSPVTTTGSISVSSSPSGASVYLDGGTTAIGVTPLTKSGITAGTHSLTLRKAGYLDYGTSVSVTGGKTTTITATLTPAGSSVKPNDPYFTKLYGLHNTGQTGGTSDADIDAPEAWAITRGSPAVIVAVIDTGVDYNHPDLAANCIAGYDYANNDADPMDDNGHGTHVAGTIAATGNNAIGVAGVTWNTRIMPLKFLSASGSGYTSNAIKAINYAKQHGATIASCSWGSSGTDKALQDAITNAPGILFVCAAGNSAKNTDIYPQSPASLPNANILAVAASDAKDRLASFSNYGAKTVDVAAPGVSILSTTPGSSYAYMSGTSMATPHVSGIAALIKAKKPSLTTSQVKDLIIRYVDKKPAFSGKMVSGGRVNAYLAVKAA